MTDSEVVMVRVYLTERTGQLKELMAYLHDRSKVKGVTAFRGIAGFGKLGHMHSASLLDMSFDLPIVLEFFDEPARAHAIIKHLKTLVEPEHIVFWPARVGAATPLSC